jgi:hypothetical protein
MWYTGANGSDSLRRQSMATHPSVNVDDLVRRTRRYEFSDGLVELQISAVLLSVGVLVALVFGPVFSRLVLGLSRALGSWAKWLAVLILLLPPLVAYGGRHLLRYVRRRWLWRASGFVEPLPSAVSRWTLVLATALVVVSIVVGLLLVRSGYGGPMLLLRILVASVGWAQGATMIGVSRATGLSHHAWVGIVGGLASTALLLVELPFGQAWLALSLLWALAFAVSGLVSLRRALLRTREVNRGG